jgi:hypothetical protein
MDVNAIVYCRTSAKEKTAVAQQASLNVKRVYFWNRDWTKPESENPYLVMELQELKTTWHPIEQIGASGGKY